MWAQGRMLHVDNRGFGGQLCVLFVFMWESGLWHRVWPMPASSRLHIDSAAACVCVYICRGGAGHVWAQGRMLCGDNHVFGGQLCILFVFMWVGGVWHRV